MSEPRHPGLRRVYARQGSKKDLWDEWAESYDKDLLDDLGYVAHQQAGEYFKRLVTDKSARILDAGCGTGLAGAYLTAHGYDNVHANDYSQAMLDVAARRNAYRALTIHDLTQPLDADPYDAILCVGVFAFFPPHVNDLRHLVAGVKPGGIVVVTVNGKGWIDRDWPTLLEQAQAAGSFKVLETTTIPYLRTEGIDGRILRLAAAD